MNRNGMRYMWKFFLLLMLVVTSCSEKQIDGNVINVAEAMSRLSEGQSVQNLFSSISYIPLETNEQAIIGKYPECIIMDSAILVSSVHQNLKLFDRTNGKYIRDIGHVGTDRADTALQCGKNHRKLQAAASGHRLCSGKGYRGK